MSKLKAIDMIVNDDYKTKVYLKSEADKVIAHNKHRRCLAMAKMCCGKSTICMLGEHYDRKRFYNKWHLRWLELAEKFKER